MFGRFDSDDTDSDAPMEQIDVAEEVTAEDLASMQAKRNQAHKIIEVEGAHEKQYSKDLEASLKQLKAW